jgi:succinate dehydrogenase / fumarate reductase cytochrome b subunit
MATFINTLWQGLWYKGGVGNWSYQFHRLAGIATLLFLVTHILDTATVFFFPDLYIHAIELYRSVPFMLGEIALVAGVLYHGMNGLKIIFFDVQPSRWTHANEQKANVIVYIGTFVLWLPAAMIMANSMYQHSILPLLGGK